MDSQPTHIAESSPELIAIREARRVVRDPLYDADEATRLLLREAEGGLTRRAELLKHRFRTIQIRLTEHANRSIAKKNAVIRPKRERFSQLQARADALAEETQQRSKELDDPRTSRKRKRQLIVAAKNTLAELTGIKYEMEKAMTPIAESIHQMENELQIAKPLWTGIQGAGRLAFRLHMALIWVRFQSFAVRVVYLLIALALAIAIDRYTPFTESVLGNVPLEHRHDMAVSLLFFFQALLFEPLFSKIKKALSWSVHSYLTGKAESLLVCIEQYESQMASSEHPLAILENSVP
jgi:hypothetical protein